MVCTVNGCRAGGWVAMVTEVESSWTEVAEVVVVFHPDVVMVEECDVLLATAVGVALVLERVMKLQTLEIDGIVAACAVTVHEAVMLERMRTLKRVD